MNDVEKGTSGDAIRVSAHRTNMDERDNTFGGVLAMLIDEVIDRGIPLREYVQNGGVGFGIVEFDYVGFYVAVAESLRKADSRNAGTSAVC